MPQMKKSRLALMEEIETACFKHAENIFYSTVRSELEDKGYTFARYLNGELDEETSNEVRTMILDGRFPDEFTEAFIGVEFMREIDQYTVPDFVLKNKAGEYAARIEATVFSTIELLDQNILDEIYRFAEAWENDRPNLRNQLYCEFREQLRQLKMSADQFADVVTIIEV